MSITAKPKPVTQSAESFLRGAPDARSETAAPASPGVYEKGIPKGNKRQISLTIAPEMLRKVDEVAKRTGQARAAVINLALYKAIEGDMFK